MFGQKTCLVFPSGHSTCLREMPGRQRKKVKERCFFRRHWRTKLHMVRLFTIFRNYNTVSKLLYENRSLIRYHVRKVFDPSFHSGPVGGPSYPKTKLKRSCDSKMMIVVTRYFYFSSLFTRLIFRILKFKPSLSLVELTNFVSMFLGLKISKSTMSRFLIRNRWSWKIPTRVQLNKYSQKNKEAYTHYLGMSPHSFFIFLLI